MYYVYLYFDPRQSPPQPFYVGRGKGKRDVIHLAEAAKFENGVPFEIAKKKRLNVFKINVINNIKRQGLTPIIEHVSENLTLEESKQLERELIKSIGRRIFGEGPLTNLTEGGEGRVICHAGPLNPFFGKSCSDFMKMRLSETHKGKILSAEQKQKISESLKGKPKKHTTKEAMRTSLRERYLQDPTHQMFTVLGKSRQKTWMLQSPEGHEVKVESLRAWCLAKGFSNKTLISAFKKRLAVSSGPAKGWKIISCD